MGGLRGLVALAAISGATRSVHLTPGRYRVSSSPSVVVYVAFHGDAGEVIAATSTLEGAAQLNVPRVATHIRIWTASGSSIVQVGRVGPLVVAQAPSQPSEPARGGRRASGSRVQPIVGVGLVHEIVENDTNGDGGDFDFF